MEQVTEQAETPDFAPDDDEAPLFPEGSGGEETGSLPGDAGESGAEDGTPLPPEPGQEPPSEPDAPAEGDDGQGQGQEEEPAADAGSELAGKRVVLAGPNEAGPFQVITRAHINPGDGAEPALFEGDDREARLDALDRVESLGKHAAERPGTIFLATVPAASWKPRAPKPRPRKSDWSV